MLQNVTRSDIDSKTPARMIEPACSYRSQFDRRDIHHEITTIRHCVCASFLISDQADKHLTASVQAAASAACAATKTPSRVRCRSSSRASAPASRAALRRRLSGSVLLMTVHGTVAMSRAAC